MRACRWLERRNQHWFPEFVHVLRINPNKLDKVRAVLRCANSVRWGYHSMILQDMLPCSATHPVVRCDMQLAAICCSG